MDELTRLDRIAGACLAAHEATADAEPRLRAMLEAVLMELGFRIAAAQAREGIGPDEVMQMQERETAVGRRVVRRTAPRRRPVPAQAHSWPPRKPVAKT